MVTFYMSLLRIPCTVTDASLHHALENSPLTFCALRSKIIPKHITKQTYKHTTSGRDCAVPLGNRSKVRSQGVSSIRLQGRTSSNSDTGFQTHHCRTACRSGTHSIASCGLRHLVLSFTPSPSCGLRHRVLATLSFMWIETCARMRTSVEAGQQSKPHPNPQRWPAPLLQQAPPPWVHTIDKPPQTWARTPAAGAFAAVAAAAAAAAVNATAPQDIIFHFQRPTQGC